MGGGVRVGCVSSRESAVADTVADSRHAVNRRQTAERVEGSAAVANISETTFADSQMKPDHKLFFRVC